MNSQQTVHDLATQMNNDGLYIDAVSLDISGKLKRCGTNSKPRSKNGWYIIYINGDFITAVYGDYQQGGTPITWHSRSKNTLTNTDRAQLYATSVALRKQREQEKVELLAKLREDYSKYVKPLSGNHSYLGTKGITAWLQMSIADPLCVMGWGGLVVPMRNLAGDLMGFQTISPNSGTKRFATGSQKKGNFYCIAPDSVTVANADRIFIVEGLATGVSTYLAMNELLDSCNYIVLVAFDVGNISNVVDVVWSLCPDKYITLIADNDDIGADKNVGIDACNAITTKYHNCNIKVYAPSAVNKD